MLQEDSVNPYAPPSSEVAEPRPVESASALASPWRRLGAVLIDALLNLAVMLPLQFYMGVYRGFPKVQISFAQTLAWGAVGFLLWLAMHGYLLATQSQTVGKRALGIQIVDATDGLPASLQKTVLLRYVPINIAAFIPIVGSLLCLVDAVFIFRADRRCIHDFIAGTRVILKPSA